ncbi:MAG: O-antigen ligase family protein [Proteobacteria bacterium]|nr:O-antigen ligase family protein [Pseudomonadota bacterium]
MKKISYALFIGPLVFAPLAFGTVEHWSLLVMQLMIAAAICAFCMQRKQTTEKLLRVPGLLPLIILVGWMILQIVPLPVTIVKILSPETYQVYKPVYDMLEGNSWMPLSVYAKGTMLECIRITTYIFFYILTVQILSDSERLKRTVMICSWLAIGIGFVAILQKFSSPEKIYWLRSVPSNTMPIGPWVYRSQYCGFVELVAPLVLALALYYRPLVASEESLRKRIVAFFSKDDGGNFYILLGFGLLVLASSVFISLARGGIIALCLSLLFFFLLLAWKEAKYSNLLYMGFFSCLVLSVSWFGWDPIVERFDKIFTSTGELNVDRFLIWQDSWQLFKDFWLTGSGFGTFIAAFPHYRTFPGESIYDHAHNDYLELLTDGGIIGFLLAAWFVLAVIHQGWKMLRRRRDRYSILLSIGALAGIVALLIHSISDFNMHNGAVGLYFFFICGLLVSAGHTRFHYQMNTTLLPKSSWLSQNILLFAGGVFFCLVVFGQGGVTLAQYQYNSIKHIYLSRQLSEQRLQEVSSGLQSAARLDPLEGLYPFYQGDVQRYLNNPEKALSSYILASLKDPLDGAFLQRIGLLLPRDRQKDAEYLLEIGAQRTLKKDQLMLTRVEWLLVTTQRSKAIEVLREAIAVKPNLLKVVMPLLQSFSFTREELAAVLPDSVESWLQCGIFTEKTGTLEDAAYFWQHALDFLDKESTIQPGWFSHLFNYYKKQKNEEKALEVLRLGIEKIPNYPRFHEWLGDYYAKEGIVYRALEEYQQALLLEPLNEALRRKIEKLSKPQQK